MNQFSIITCVVFLCSVVLRVYCTVEGTDRTDYCHNGGILTSCQCSCKSGFWGVNCEKSEFIGGCESLPQAGIKKSGVYVIHVAGALKSVYCDVCSETGLPWTVIQRRTNGLTSFQQTWATYAAGFGAPDAEFWFGLRSLATITQSERHVLRFELTISPGIIAWAEYDDFRIGNETTKFRLESIGHYTGNAGDSLSYSLGMMFTTMDSDNDQWAGTNANCAFYKSGYYYCGGAWWHKVCTQANLNGQYGLISVYSNLCGQGLTWNTLTGMTKSLRQTVMMIRPYRLGVPETTTTTTTTPTTTTTTSAPTTKITHLPTTNKDTTDQN